MEISRKKTTKWNLFFFYVRTFIGLANGILIVPIYLKFIDHDLFGAWLASGNILTWITMADPGVGDVLIQKVSVAYSRKDKHDVKYIISSALIISTIVSIIALAASIVLSYFIVGILKLPQTIPAVELTLAFQINAIATCITLFSYCLSGTILGFQRTKEIGLILTVTGILGIALNVFLLYTGTGLVSIAYANLFKSGASMGAFVVFLYFLFRREKLSLAFNREYFFSFSKIFSYTFFSKILGTIANNFDLIIVSRFVGPQAVTVLELTRRPIKVVQGFVNSPSIAMLPAFANLYGEGDKEKMRNIIKRFLNILSWILFLFITGFITFNKDLINLWVGEQFFAGSLNNMLICLYFFIITITYNLSNFTYSMGNIKGNSLMEIIKNTLYIILLLALGKSFGITGVIIASLLPVLFTDLWYYPKKVFKLAEYKTDDLYDIQINSLKLFLVSFFLIIVFTLFNINSWHLLILKAGVFSLIYVALLYLLIGVFRKETAAFLTHLVEFKNSKNEKNIDIN